MLFNMKDVHKYYTDDGGNITKAINGINFEIKEKDFIALVGPSGSGKTTFLNLLAGLSTPTKGDIFHKEIHLSELNSDQRTKHRLNNMGFIFQNYRLLPVLTAKENVMLPLQLKRINSSIAEKMALETLQELNVGELAYRYPRTLSGGQQQRVAIARAIVDHPSVVLADEPTANLDSETAQQIIDIFKNLNEKYGLTFIFSTHDQRLIDQVKTLLYIKDGKLENSPRG